MNLAIADFLSLLFCPGFYDFALHKFQLGSGTLGDIFCKFIAGNAIVCVSFDASVLTLCAIAMERYLGIVKPFNKRWALTKKNVNYYSCYLGHSCFFKLSRYAMDEAQ